MKYYLNTAFFNSIENSFSRAFTDQMRDGIDLILLMSRKLNIYQRAYILATAYWESGMTLQPVREGLKSDDESAIEYVNDLYMRGIIRQNYAEPAAYGNSFYGRGLVQLTWEKNYSRVGSELWGDEDLLVKKPDIVLNPIVSADILINGMKDGLFTEYSLGDFINDDKKDFVNARKVVNCEDQAEKIAHFADNFLTAIEQHI